MAHGGALPSDATGRATARLRRPRGSIRLCSPAHGCARRARGRRRILFARALLFGHRPQDRSWQGWPIVVVEDAGEIVSLSSATVRCPASFCAIGRSLRAAAPGMLGFRRGRACRRLLAWAVRSFAIPRGCETFFISFRKPRLLTLFRFILPPLLLIILGLRSLLFHMLLYFRPLFCAILFLLLRRLLIGFLHRTVIIRQLVRLSCNLILFAFLLLLLLLLGEELLYPGLHFSSALFAAFLPFVASLLLVPILLVGPEDLPLGKVFESPPHGLSLGRIIAVILSRSHAILDDPPRGLALDLIFDLVLPGCGDVLLVLLVLLFLLLLRPENLFLGLCHALVSHGSGDILLPILILFGPENLLLGLTAENFPIGLFLALVRHRLGDVLLLIGPKYLPVMLRVGSLRLRLTPVRVVHGHGDVLQRRLTADVALPVSLRSGRNDHRRRQLAREHVVRTCWCLGSREPFNVAFVLVAFGVGIFDSFTCGGSSELDGDRAFGCASPQGEYPRQPPPEIIDFRVGQLKDIGLDSREHTRGRRHVP
mmetsp:Transcript_73736/g.205089  ORF Transcript_73736/g.205089 Transcript_73736/m.205089 type:complete len:538 (-) Transcript_73736:69-1682(-)